MGATATDAEVSVFVASFRGVGSCGLRNVMKTATPTTPITRAKRTFDFMMTNLADFFRARQTNDSLMVFNPGRVSFDERPIQDAGVRKVWVSFQGRGSVVLVEFRVHSSYGGDSPPE